MKGLKVMVVIAQNSLEPTKKKRKVDIILFIVHFKQ
jgi:hypothetical protein